MKSATNLLKNWLAGKFYALNFSGGGTDYVTVAYNAILNLVNAFTVECWLVPDTSDTSQGYVDKTVGDVTNSQWWLGAEGGFFKCRVKKTTTTDVVSTAAAFTNSNGVRTHLAVTYDGATLQVYVNGVASGSPVSLAAPLDGGSGTLFIGRLGTDAPIYACKGKMDGVRVYSRALSSGEVAQHYQGDFRNESGLVGLWEFDEGTGTSIADLSGNSNTGTVVGSPTFQLFNPYPGRHQELRYVDLYTITTISGIVARFASSDFAISSGGNAFSVVGARFERSKVSLKLGLEVSELEIQVYAKDTDLIGTNPLVKAIRMGVLDNATIKVERAVLAGQTGLVVGVMTNFLGMIAECNASRGKALLRCKSHLHLLNTGMPKHDYQPGCVHTLYDVGCTLNRNSFKQAGTVAAGSTASTINSSGFAQASGTFDLGYIQFTSGVLNGQRASVKTYTEGATDVFKLNYPLEAVPGIGDSFDAFFGCDKQLATCTNKFANQVNFLATPFVPKPETVL